MSFSTWKNNSKLYAAITARMREHKKAVDRLCEAAYKAGQRDGISRGMEKCLIPVKSLPDPVSVCQDIAARREAESELWGDFDLYRSQGARECAEALQHNQETP